MMSKLHISFLYSKNHSLSSLAFTMLLSPNHQCFWNSVASRTSAWPALLWSMGRDRQEALRWHWPHRKSGRTASFCRSKLGARLRPKSSVAESSKATWLTLTLRIWEWKPSCNSDNGNCMMASTDGQVRCSLQGRLEKEDDGAYVFRGLGKKGPRAS